MEEAGSEGGGGTSAAAAHAGDGAGTGDGGAGAGGASGTSAAAAHAGDGEGAGDGGAGAGATAGTDNGGGTGAGGAAKTDAGAAGAGAAKEPDYAKMTDEDYAKAVIPDAKEGEAQPDRSLITLMAKDLREQKIDPAQVAKISAVYDKAVKAEIERRNKAEDERLAGLREACEKEIKPEEWKDFSAAYRKFVTSDEVLRHFVDNTELGSNPAFIRLIALAGASVRVDAPPPATAAAGGGQTSLDQKVFLATVPEHLR